MKLLGSRKWVNPRRKVSALQGKDVCEASASASDAEAEAEADFTTKLHLNLNR